MIYRFTELSMLDICMSDSYLKYLYDMFTDCWNGFKQCISKYHPQDSDPQQWKYGYVDKLGRKIIKPNSNLHNSEDRFWIDSTNRDSFVSQSSTSFIQSHLFNCVDFANCYKEYCDRVLPKKHKCVLFLYRYWNYFDGELKVRLHLAPKYYIKTGTYCHHMDMIFNDKYDPDKFRNRFRTVYEFAKRFCLSKMINAEKVKITVLDNKIPPGTTYDDILKATDPDLLRRLYNNMNGFEK